MINLIRIGSIDLQKGNKGNIWARGFSWEIKKRHLFLWRTVVVVIITAAGFLFFSLLVGVASTVTYRLSPRLLTQPTGHRDHHLPGHTEQTVPVNRAQLQHSGFYIVTRTVLTFHICLEMIVFNSSFLSFSDCRWNVWKRVLRVDLSSNRRIMWCIEWPWVTFTSQGRYINKVFVLVHFWLYYHTECFSW